jgi:hypothetical protein
LLLDSNIAVLGDNAAVSELVLIALDSKLIVVDNAAVFVVKPLTLANIRSAVTIDSISVDWETILVVNLILEDSELVVVDTTDMFEVRFA